MTATAVQAYLFAVLDLVDAMDAGCETWGFEAAIVRKFDVAVKGGVGLVATIAKVDDLYLRAPLNGRVVGIPRVEKTRKSAAQICVRMPWVSSKKYNGPGAERNLRGAVK